MESVLCIGIDVSQEWLDLSVYPTGQARRFRTTPAGLRSLSKYCRDAQPRLIAFETSGGYERPLADSLTQAQLPFVVLNPRNVRSYARSVGVLAKTDRIDAAVIARFASVNQLSPEGAALGRRTGGARLGHPPQPTRRGPDAAAAPSPLRHRHKPGQRRAPSRLPQAGGRRG